MRAKSAAVQKVVAFGAREGYAKSELAQNGRVVSGSGVLKIEAIATGHEASLRTED